MHKIGNTARGPHAPREESVRAKRRRYSADAFRLAERDGHKSRPGVVLLVVLVVVMMLALGAYTYAALMRSHRESSVLTNRQLQAKLMVDSGIDYTRIYLSRSDDAQSEAGGKYNNPASFRQLVVVQDLDPLHRGYFTIVAPALDDEGNLAGVRFGLEDESTRLNLNTLLTLEKSGVASLASSAGALQSAAGALQAAGGGAQSGAGSQQSTSGSQQPASGNQQSSSGSQASSSASSETGSSASSSAAASESTSAARTLLMAVPGMTEDAADSILDWIDEDDEARTYGAESAYYMSLEPPYAPKNGPLDTVEELLRVKGVTPQLLFGADTNRNGQIDPNEASTGSAAPAAAFDSAGTTASFGVMPTSAASTTGTVAGSLDRGWSAYLTLHSRERNLTPEGQPRIYLNNPDLEQLHAELSDVFDAEWANFIVAFRQGSKVSSGSSGGQGGSSGNQQGGDASAEQPAESAAGRAIDFNKAAKTKFTQVLDLIDARIQVQFAGEEKAIVVQSPFRSDLGAAGAYLPKLMDYVTVNPAASIPGRINILQAPAPILRGIPGITDEIVDQILNRREPELTTEKPNRRHETWLLAEGAVTLSEMKLLQPFICSGGHVYRSQVVGYFQNGEGAARAEAIFDATGALPRVVLWRDMSHLGRGYALETLGIDFTE